jgi:predicted glutamine amidotransferase
MCLIIASPNGVVPTCGVIDQGWQDNSDGWGLMQSDGSDLIVNKGMKFDDLKPLLEKINGNPYVLHYRWATHGTKNIDNCHPFRITKKLYMAHNGVIAIEQKNKLMSDTWHYAQTLRQIGIDHDNVTDEEIISMMAKSVGGGNKLAFLDAQGKVTLVNEQAGTWKEGVWYSNTHSFYSIAASNNRYARYYNRYYHHRSASWDWDQYDNSKSDNCGWDSWETPKEKRSMGVEDLITAQDLKKWEEGSDIWGQCEYCGTLDWLDMVDDCDQMTLCVPCRKVLTPIFMDSGNQVEGLNAGLYYDSNGVPYSWDDVDDKIVEVRSAYEGRG